MDRYRRLGLTVLIALSLASGVVACSGFSLFGGVAGGVLTLLAIVFWFATATTQTGCTTQACLSLNIRDAEFETDVGPCLSDAGVDPRFDVGPCLSALPPDAEVEDATEDGGPIGPCLSIAPPDAEVGDDAGEPDADSDPDASPDVASLRGRRTPAVARGEAIERLAQRGVLPADVVARLKTPVDEEPS